jgi:hypothetical protein
MGIDPLGCVCLGGVKGILEILQTRQASPRNWHNRLLSELVPKAEVEVFDFVAYLKQKTPELNPRNRAVE